MGKNRSTFTLKRTLRAIAGTATLGCALLAAHGAYALDLRHHSVVSDNQIRLGDVFTGLNGPGLEHKADRVLGIAPRPGDEMVLDARTLQRVAIALDLPWRPTSHADQVVLTRAATVIDRALIESVLRDELVAQGLDGAFNMIIPSANSEIILPHDQPQSVEVVSMRYNPTQNRFEAQLAAPSKADQVRSLTVHGNVQRLIEVPVLRSTLRNGDVIGQRDIDYIEVPLQQIKHNVILDPRDLIGMTPRRVLITDKVIKSDDIEAPRIVSRGENVTMIFKEGGLVLTAQGKAMEFGSKGDHIRVTNLNSNKTVEAVVSGVKEVTVRSF